MKVGLSSSATTRAFMDNATLKLGDGANARFWRDTWTGDKPLMELFPRCFKLSLLPEISVKEWFEGSGGGFSRSPHFARAMRGRLADEYERLLDLLSNATRPCDHGHDRAAIRCEEAMSELFSNKTMMCLCCDMPCRAELVLDWQECSTFYFFGSGYIDHEESLGVAIVSYDSRYYSGGFRIFLGSPMVVSHLCENPSCKNFRMLSVADLLITILLILESSPTSFWR
ncbi:hypothetical protein Dimus_009970 [Dionaea muscipula]